MEKGINVEENKEEENKTIGFGDFVEIEMKSYGVPNEIYIHKVITRYKSNTWVDIPVKSPATETMHKEIEEVVDCICCGVVERDVFAYRVKDVKFAPRGKKNII